MYLVGFAIEVYYEARSYERQNRSVIDCVKTCGLSLLSLLCLNTYDRLSHNIRIYETVHSKS